MVGPGHRPAGPPPTAGHADQTGRPQHAAGRGPPRSTQRDRGGSGPRHGNRTGPRRCRRGARPFRERNTIEDLGGVRPPGARGLHHHRGGRTGRRGTGPTCSSPTGPRSSPMPSYRLQLRSPTLRARLDLVAFGLERLRRPGRYADRAPRGPGCRTVARAVAGPEMVAPTPRLGGRRPARTVCRPWRSSPSTCRSSTRSPRTTSGGGRASPSGRTSPRAGPRFPGHYQPHLPGRPRLLRPAGPRDPRRAGRARPPRTASTASSTGTTGSPAAASSSGRSTRCSALGEPDFPFASAWANQTWAAIWHGAPDRVLIEQTYPGPDDDRAHFASLLPASRTSAT